MSRSFSDRSFLSPPSGRGRPRLRVMDVRTKMLVFLPRFPGPDRSFFLPPDVRRDIRVDVRGISGPPKLTLWAVFSFQVFRAADAALRLEFG